MPGVEDFDFRKTFRTMGIFSGSFVLGSKLVVLGMVIPPLIGNPYNGYINPYYWVDDHPLLYGNNGWLIGIRIFHGLRKNPHITGGAH